MKKWRRVAFVRRDQTFKGRGFTAEVILWAARWYLMFPISYRDLKLMLQDRGVEVDHTTIFRGSKPMPLNWKADPATPTHEQWLLAGG